MVSADKKNVLLQGKRRIIMNKQIRGLIAAPYTAFQADGGLNLARIEHQARALVQDGVVGAFVCGTTGEWASMTTAERMAVAARWREVAPPDFAVMVHVGHNCQVEAVELARHAAEIGANGVGAIAPSFFKPASERELVEFFVPIAAAAPELPFYYYHFPGITGVNVSAAKVLDIAAGLIPNLAGVKFTYENLMDYGQCLRLRGGQFQALFGRDEMLLGALSLGAQGAVGSTYNFAGPIFVRLIEAFERGDLEAARREQDVAWRFIEVLNAFGGLAAGKALMKLVGIDCGPVRSPLRSLTEDEVARMGHDLEAAGFFAAVK